MSSNQEGPKKGEKRAWSSGEEEVLLGAVKGLVDAGWKTDNGFKAGYLKQLESKLPGWKRTYATLRDILASSCVGFNLTGDNKIDCLDDHWEELCRPNLSIKNWRKKSWNYLEDWKFIFGKDSATGETTAEFMEMVNELVLDREGPSTEPPMDPADMVHTDDNADASAADDSAAQSSARTSRPPKNMRKRHFDESISVLVDLVGNIQQTNAAKYDAFNDSFVNKVGVKKTRGDVLRVLQTIPGLNMDEAFDVGEKLFSMPERLEMFLELTEDARPSYVSRILNLDN